MTFENTTKGRALVVPDALSLSKKREAQLFFFWGLEMFLAGKRTGFDKITAVSSFPQRHTMVQACTVFRSASKCVARSFCTGRSA